MTDTKNFNKINAVIAIVIAFIAWVYVVYNYSPMKTVTYTNVPIKYEGLETLANRGLGIKSSTNDSIDVRLDVERVHFTDVSSDDIVVTADVSQALEGHNGVSLEITPPEGTILKASNVKMISVEVSHATTKDVDLTTVYEASSGDGTEPIGKTMSYRRVSVFGCAENIDLVKYAVVKIVATDLVSDTPKSFVLDTIAVDEDGREVPHVLVLPSEVAVNAMIGETKDVDLVLDITNVEAGMSCTAPKTVKIKGTADALKNIEKIETEPADLAGVKEDTVFSINYKLPDGVYISKASLGKTINISKEK